jgi:predicted RND superfamily exporter protein
MVRRRGAGITSQAFINTTTPRCGAAILVTAAITVIFAATIFAATTFTATITATLARGG